MSNILFVCTANRCRSPMAERLFYHKLINLTPDRAENWMVGSAGTWATNNHKPDANLIASMESYGIDIRDHRSRSLNDKMVTQQDLILVMENHHLEAMRFEYPDSAPKIFLLSQLIGNEFDIEDPFDKDLKDYQRAARLIDEILSQGFSRIFQLAQD